MDAHGRGPSRDLALYHMQEELLESDYIQNNEHIFQKNPVALERWLLHTIAENFDFPTIQMLDNAYHMAQLQDLPFVEIFQNYANLQSNVMLTFMKFHF
ncbi:unnamed protein product [Rhizophagus irregularis]|uniref:Uncharacterized protein n=1 Tax=Rhizophagus irregularis TaxID=588596 RepID=A0A915Z6A3_9GLOM|nr:unnamed protein product [Rhizophagus irregularis]